METTINYTFDIECWKKGYVQYSRAFRKTKNIAVTVVFGVLALLFLEQIIRDPEYGAGWLCMGVSLMMALINLLNPKMEKKRLFSSLENITGDKYALRIYEDKFTVETVSLGDGGDVSGIAPVEIMLSEKSLKVFEEEDYFGLFSKTFFAVVPKKELNVYEISALQDLANKISSK